MSENMLTLSETFLSVQGESTFAGQKCYFLRLSGCNLDCRCCDTSYRNEKKIRLSVEAAVKQIRESGSNLVEFTGGEPLMQQALLLEVIDEFVDEPYTFLIETNGSYVIDEVTKRSNTVVVVDVKAPSTGMLADMRLENLDHVRPHDEVKFVLADEDIDWFSQFYREHAERIKGKVLLSPMAGEVSLHTLSLIHI